MASKFRRTLSLEDLVNGSEDEMEELLNPTTQASNNNKPTSKSYSQARPIKIGIRVGHIIAPGIDSPENDDFFLHGPQAPILNLENSEFTQEIENSSSITNVLPRSKSVRFEDQQGQDRLKLSEQVNQVTGRMKDNVARLLDREANLGSLQDLSDQLQYSSDIYRQSSEHLRRKMWWRQQRTRLVLGAIFVIGIFFLLIPLLAKLLQ